MRVAAAPSDVARCFTRDLPALCLVDAHAWSDQAGLLRATLRDLAARRRRALFLAPTAAEAARLRELTPPHCAVHEILPLLLERRNKVWKEHALILAGADQLDALLLSRLLGRLGPWTGLMLVGDPALPPPPRPGSPFHDLVQCQVAPVLRLAPTPDGDSDLPAAAARILAGRSPAWGGAVRRLTCERIESLPLALAQACGRLRENFAPEEVQVLTSAQEGPAGSNELQAVLARRDPRRGRTPAPLNPVLTCEQARSRRWEAVVLVAHEEAELDRDLLYLAITRARRALVVVGQEEAVDRAVRHVSPLRRRRTLLAGWLGERSRPPGLEASA